MQTIITNARLGRRLSRNRNRNRRRLLANAPAVPWIIAAAVVAITLYFSA